MNILENMLGVRCLNMFRTSGHVVGKLLAIVLVVGFIANTANQLVCAL